jgi:putative RecB family exonuclease
MTEITIHKMIAFPNGMARYSPLRFRVFDTCRLRYRYQYVDKVRARLRPSDTAGSLVHRVLFDFFSKVPREEHTPERLLQMFEDGWNALSPRYLQMPGVDQHRAASVRQLENFAAHHDLHAEPLAIEAYLQVDVAPRVTLFGRMDRIDEEPDGTLHIIDYKTGEQPSEVEARQIRLYAIMVERELERMVSKASFWYLDDGTTSTETLDDSVKRLALEEMLAAVEEMQRITDFPPTIAEHCAHCPYYHACEARLEIDRRRKAEGW